MVQDLVGALERRGELEVVRLAPGPGQVLRRWRHVELPRILGQGGLAGLHAFTSAFPLWGKGLRVQTVHELPWRHAVRENADLAHRFWAGPGAARAASVLPSSAVSSISRCSSSLASCSAWGATVRNWRWCPAADRRRNP